MPDLAWGALLLVAIAGAVSGLNRRRQRQDRLAWRRFANRYADTGER
jgi:hypothetical protein